MARSSRTRHATPMRRLMPVLGAVLVAACGGGGDDGPPPTVTVTGTAATGEALAARTVEAKCQGGTASATTAANGTYSVGPVAGTLPCALRVTTADGRTLHAVATGTGTTAVANITPFSELGVASVAGTLAATYFDGYDATRAARLTPSAVGAATAEVTDTVEAAGIDLSAVPDFRTSALVPNSGATLGNAHGQALQAFEALLGTRGISLAALAQRAADGSAANAAPSGVAQLPAALLLQPPSPTCPSLRSATYRLLTAMPGSTHAVDTFAVDAAAGTINVTEDTLTAVAGQPCRYTSSNADIVVSPAGVMVLRMLEGGVQRLGIAFPVQQHALADLSGTWQSIGINTTETTPATYFLDAAVFTVGASAPGVLSSLSYCEDVVTCTPLSTGGEAISAATGDEGYNLGTSSEYARLFAYRAGGGELMMASVQLDGSIALLSRRRPFAAPAVGNVSANWGFPLSTATLAANAVSTSAFTTETVHPDGRWDRRSQADGHLETLTPNSPREGLVTRPESTAGTTGGGTVTVRQFISLSLRGMGMSALALPTLNQLQLAVNRP